jgi:hypothetical protein
MSNLMSATSDQDYADSDECCPVHGPGNDPEDCELCEEDRNAPIAPTDERRFTVSSYFDRKSGYESSREDESADVEF